MKFNTIILITALSVMNLACNDCPRQNAAEEMPIGDGPTSSVSDSPNQADTQSKARIQWWRDAKFGMFIHWGLFSVPAGEWKGDSSHAEFIQITAKIPLAEYARLADQFNPVKFNADQWVKIARDGGVKYIVITSKHHEGFAMFDSPCNSYNIIRKTPFKRDPIKELAEACRKQDMRFCVYYSLGRDWQDPDVPTGSPNSQKFPPGRRSNLVDYPDENKKDFTKYYERKVKPQVRELLTQYGPIAVMWFDTPEKISKAQSEELLKMIRTLQPDCIVNMRIGNGLGDYDTPEQAIPSKVVDKPWETCMTMNQHWGYTKRDNQWKSTETLLRNLIDIVSKGGNYLLNVGPTAEGVIPSESVERMSEIGQWLKVNGEAIYGAGPTPFGAEIGSFSKAEKNNKSKPVFVPDWQWRATTRPGKIYIHVFKWPSGKMELPAVKNKIVKAYLLADPKHTPLTVEQNEKKVFITLPEKATDTIASVVCLELAENPKN